jgi:hypothetical protein
MVRYRKNRSGTTPCTGRRKRVRSNNNKRSATTGHPYPTTTSSVCPRRRLPTTGPTASNPYRPSDPNHGAGYGTVMVLGLYDLVLHRQTTGVNRSGKQEWKRSVDDIPNIKGASSVVPVTETTVPGLCHPHVTIAGQQQHSDDKVTAIDCQGLSVAHHSIRGTTIPTLLSAQSTGVCCATLFSCAHGVSS